MSCSDELIWQVVALRLLSEGAVEATLYGPMIC